MSEAPNKDGIQSNGIVFASAISMGYTYASDYVVSFTLPTNPLSPLSRMDGLHVGSPSDGRAHAEMLALGP